MNIREVISLVAISLSLCAAAQEAVALEGQPQKDRWSEIAAQQLDYRDRDLVPITPPKLVQRLLPMDTTGIAAAFQPATKMTTFAQVQEEMRRQRKVYAPFLRNLAPPLKEKRLCASLDSFDWRVETTEDQADFSATLAGKGKWQRVEIPHYGPPMGRAVTYYRTEFDVTPAMMEQGALFVHFKGVDYKAHIFVNGTLLGSHEGYFAPFEFEFTRHARVGKNVLLVKVAGDYPMIGANEKTGYVGGPRYSGLKISVVSPGWNDPNGGWQHCPPGMGIYQDVTIEARRRIHVSDIFVRPLKEEGRAEAWIEVVNCDYRPAKVAFQLSVYGQNFSATVLHEKIEQLPGLAELNVAGGVSCFKIPLAIPQPRLWEPDAPWLYQLQVRLVDHKGRLLDAAKRQFGLRTFRMEYAREPKGRMYLNGRPVKLRGANTQGAFAQRIMHKDWNGLIDDILLAKITHMNFIRLTQFIPQSEIYDYCDRLGMMLQTDLPLAERVIRSQFCEVVRQAEEMERLVRPHPSNVLVTYINEPTPNGGGEPQRSLVRTELTHMFEAADMVVHMANPDRVTKAVDGDYDPPGPGLPDNHCYTAWYNGHGVELGALHKGYWQRVKPGWVYGCGEFGAEGLDPVELMRKCYPKSWLPQTRAEEKQWSPAQIPGAQTGGTHHYFFETPDTLSEWVARSQAHQAWATRLLAEAFRRDRRMHSFAIHLFIDAFPDGWMKAIVDSQRRPKPAWYVYRDALTPLAVNLRTDRRAFFAGEPIDLEAWICNDLNDAPHDANLRYQLEHDGGILQAGSAAATIQAWDSTYQGTLRFQTPSVATRARVTARLGLLDAHGKVLHDTSIVLDVFPREDITLRRIYVIGSPKGKAAQLADCLGVKPVFSGPMEPGDAILIDDVPAFAKTERQVARAVREGAHAVFLNLKKGKYPIAASDVAVGSAADAPWGDRGEVHFVSRATGHPLVAGFRPDDFKFWYDGQVDRPAPLLRYPAFKADGWAPVLLSFGALAAGTKADGRGQWCISQIELANRIKGNPVAEIFARRLLATSAATGLP